MELFKKISPLLFSLFLGVIAAFSLPADAYNQSGDTIATFSGFVAAAIVPATVLAATLLRSSGINSNEIKAYRSAINEQLDFLFSVLIVATLLVLLIIFCKVIKWENASFLIYGYIINTYYILNFLITFLLSILVFKFWGFFIAVKSMFKLHADTVEIELLENQDSKLNDIFDVDRIPKDARENFGKKTNL